MYSKLKSSLIDITAPNFSLKNMDGKTVTLASLKGKVVIVDFWATWCGPCKASFPAMQKAVDKYRDNPNVVFLFINTLDTRRDVHSAVKSFISDNNYTFNVLFDEREGNSRNYKTFSSFKGKGVPVKYIIDKKGKIKMELTGFSGSDEKSVEELSYIIDMLL